MANTFTPTYNILKPEVGADTNAWGTHINNNLDIIDTHMLSRSRTTAQTVASPLTFNQTLTVLGATSLDSTLLVAGASTLNSISTTGAASFGTTMAVTGATTLNTLNVTGATTMASNGLNVGSGQLNVTGGNVSMSGALTVAGAQTFTGNTIHSGTMSVAGATTLSSSLSVTGAATFSSTATFNGAATFNNNTLTISSTAPTIRLNDTDNSGAFVHCNSNLVGFLNNSGNWAHYVDQSGNFTAVGNVTAYSDISQKSDVETIVGALELIRRMRGVRYTRINSLERGVGVIAQEMRQVLPEVIHDNDGILSVAYGNIVGVLIEGIKALEQRIRVLEAK